MLRITDKAKSFFILAVLLVTVAAAPALAGPNEDILGASQMGDRAAVETALASGASVNARDKMKLTPLAIAAVNGHNNVAALLLSRGANVEATDVLGRTALHHAATSGSTDVARLLLDHGAKVNVRDALGATPLEWAALGGHKNVAELLLGRGALVDVRALSGKTALHLAAAAGNKEMVTLLLAHGADPNIRNSDGQTPLQEMRASTLDDATKASLAAALQARPTARVQVTPPLHASPQTLAPALPEAAKTTVPNCWDVGGIARVVIQANPGIQNQPEVLAETVEQMQVAMGCRPAPQTTQCSWVGSTWTCKTE